MVDTTDSSSNLLLVATIVIIVVMLHIVSGTLPAPVLVNTPDTPASEWICGICRKRTRGATCRQCKYSKQLQKRARPAIELVHFILSTTTNILLQFESTLVAQLLVATMAPTSIKTAWVILYVGTTVCMLWLVNYSFTT